MRSIKLLAVKTSVSFYLAYLFSFGAVHNDEKIILSGFNYLFLGGRPK